MTSILIFEPYSGGHHTNYIEALVDQFGALNCKLIICTNSRHGFRAPFPEGVELDATLPHFNPASDLKTKFAIGSALRTAVKRHKPDIVVSTTADHELLPDAVLGLLGQRQIPKHVKSIAITHHGYGGLSRGWKDRLKDVVYTFASRFAKRSQIFTVNPIVFEGLKKRNIPIALLPDPVEMSQVMTKSEARTLLRLPAQGRFIGHVGAADGRKAIPELLQGFMEGRQAGDHLVIAGRIDADYRTLIDANYNAAVNDGSIILYDQFLSRSEFTAFISACDVIAPLSYPRAELSANFLNAVVLRRPVVADSFGYTGRMIELFALGARCNVHDVTSVAIAIRQAFDMAADDQTNDATQRLIDFHQVANFGATLRATIHDLMQTAHHEHPLPWDDVTEKQRPSLKMH
jgi:hypothetical protein